MQESLRLSIRLAPRFVYKLCVRAYLYASVCVCMCVYEASIPIYPYK